MVRALFEDVGGYFQYIAFYLTFLRWRPLFSFSLNPNPLTLYKNQNQPLFYKKPHDNPLKAHPLQLPTPTLPIL